MEVAIKRRVVLLVDDDVLVRNLVRRSLEAASFLVFAAADGTEALKLSGTCPERIHVLLTDIEMPALDGVALAKQIKQERRDTAILLMSAGTARAIPSGMAFIAKPFSPAELFAKIEEVLATDG
jgi:DNA-binding response OmpR family regulator